MSTSSPWMSNCLHVFTRWYFSQKMSMWFSLVAIEIHRWGLRRYTIYIIKYFDRKKSKFFFSFPMPKSWVSILIQIQTEAWIRIRFNWHHIHNNGLSFKRRTGKVRVMLTYDKANLTNRKEIHEFLFKSTFDKFRTNCGTSPRLNLSTACQKTKQSCDTVSLTKECRESELF